MKKCVSNKGIYDYSEFTALKEAPIGIRTVFTLSVDKLGPKSRSLLLTNRSCR